ncbi:hypothetical protein GCM10010495_46120 [Kitasatospora herbaricolor]|nr:hypothetical protein GCM10010495_46120 [Kitasatospora herbaricolor]
MLSYAVVVALAGVAAAVGRARPTRTAATVAANVFHLPFCATDMGVPLPGGTTRAGARPHAPQGRDLRVLTVGYREHDMCKAPTV